jgi:hypothetical protein
MKSLKYGSTTLAQAQPIFRRWNATYDDGPCESAKCSGEITIGDFAYAHAELFARHQRLFRAYGVLGGRPAFVRAGASILDGVVRSKSYSLDVEVFPSEAVGFPRSVTAWSAQRGQWRTCRHDTSLIRVTQVTE